METTIPGMRKQACPTLCRTSARLKVTLDHTLRPGQTLATFQRKILQRFCMMLRHLLNGLAKRSQHFNATCRCL